MCTGPCWAGNVALPYAGAVGSGVANYRLHATYQLQYNMAPKQGLCTILHSGGNFFAWRWEVSSGESSGNRRACCALTRSNEQIHLEVPVAGG